MKHRISAGAIVIEDHRVLLVRHYIESKHVFWVLPGGGVIDDEDILTAAVRETWEETGLTVQALRPIYVEEFLEPFTHHMKTWVLCKRLNGTLSTSHHEAQKERIIAANFFSQDDVMSIKTPIFPEIIRHQFWDDLRQGFPTIQIFRNSQDEVSLHINFPVLQSSLTQNMTVMEHLWRFPTSEAIQTSIKWQTVSSVLKLPPKPSKYFNKNPIRTMVLWFPCSRNSKRCEKEQCSIDRQI